jgi:hypothetical protein
LFNFSKKNNDKNFILKRVTESILKISTGADFSKLCGCRKIGKELFDIKKFKIVEI